MLPNSRQKEKSSILLTDGMFDTTSVRMIDAAVASMGQKNHLYICGFTRQIRNNRVVLSVQVNILLKTMMKNNPFIP